MTGQERHLIRALLAKRNGYRPIRPAHDPEWAGARLPEAVDERAAEAARSLRGLPLAKDGS